MVYKLENVFHEGEKKVQELAGEVEMANRVGRAVKSFIVGGAVNFIQNLPMAFISSTDQEGKVWISLLVGENGFVKIVDGEKVIFDLSKIKSTQSDIFYENIQHRPEVGLLFIDHAHRMRFRVNGVAINSKNEIHIQVQEAYGNCPKYIQRSIHQLPKQVNNVISKNSKGEKLGASEIAWINNADTFYLGTRSLSGKSDATHRGGNVGFVEVLENGSLRIPDYPGNAMFNSLGNIYENPNAGLLFVNFEEGTTLQLSGKGEIQFNQKTEDDLKKTGDTGRFWLFHPEQWILTEHHHELDWKFMDFSPFNP